MKKVLVATFGIIIILVGFWVPSWLMETLPEVYDIACLGTALVFIVVGLLILVSLFPDSV